jgi:hypothetical protein
MINVPEKQTIILVGTDETFRRYRLNQLKDVITKTKVQANNTNQSESDKALVE